MQHQCFVRWSWESTEFCGLAVHSTEKIRAGRPEPQHIQWRWAWALFQLLLYDSRGVWRLRSIWASIFSLNEDLILRSCAVVPQLRYKTYFQVLQIAEGLDCHYNYISVTKVETQFHHCCLLKLLSVVQAHAPWTAAGLPVLHCLPFCSGLQFGILSTDLTLCPFSSC